METVGLEPTSTSLQARCSPGLSYVPWCKARTGGVEPPQPEASALQAAELACAQRPQEQKGDRPDSNRYREDHGLGCCRYTTATTYGDDRIRTGGRSPDKRAL